MAFCFLPKHWPIPICEEFSRGVFGVKWGYLAGWSEDLHFILSFATTKTNGMPTMIPKASSATVCQLMIGDSINLGVMQGRFSWDDERSF